MKSLANQTIVAGCAMGGAVGGTIFAFNKNAKTGAGIVLAITGAIVGAAIGFGLTLLTPASKEKTLQDF